MTINPYDSPLSPSEPPEKKPDGWGPRLIEVLVVIFITAMLVALYLLTRPGAHSSAITSSRSRWSLP